MKLKPGLEPFYAIRPRNGLGWFYSSSAAIRTLVTAQHSTVLLDHGPEGHLVTVSC